MAVAHARISVATEATKLSSDFAGNDGQTLNIQNPVGGADVFLGGTGVTTASYGFQLLGGSSMSIDLLEGESLFAVVAASTQTVNVILQGV